jgi:hypothetical protein
MGRGLAVDEGERNREGKLAPAGEIVAGSSLAMFISGFTLWVLLLLLGGAVGLFIVLRWRKLAPRKLRITIHPKERVVLVAEGKRKPKNCPACWLALEEGGPRARCAFNPGHEIHDDCRQLVQGKCPVCNGKLI